MKLLWPYCDELVVMRRHKSGAISYFSPRLGFSINEGGTPVNIHVSWKYRMLYLYAWGRRLVLRCPRKPL